MGAETRRIKTNKENTVIPTKIIIDANTCVESVNSGRKIHVWTLPIASIKKTPFHVAGNSVARMSK